MRLVAPDRPTAVSSLIWMKGSLLITSILRAAPGAANVRR